jgi:penicillin-binding protein 1C
MALLLPREGSAVYVPRELDGSTGRVVFEAAHREIDAAVFWHLDEDYVGVTRDIHQLGLAPSPGTHRLTLVDSDGNRLERVFEVISPERNESTSPVAPRR